MSIEFSCANCGQNLRVSDESAGKRAKCPKCSQINEIPHSVSPEVDDDLDELRLAPEEPKPAADPSPFGAPSPNPFGAPQGDTAFGGAQPNPYSAPMTGYSTSGAMKTLDGAGKITNVPTDVGSVLNYAFALWQQHLGILVGATITVWAINQGLSWGTSILATVIMQAGGQEVGMIVHFMGIAVQIGVYLYLGIGVSQLMLKLARNERAEFSDVFNAGSRFLPVLGVGILFVLAYAGGFILLFIPGIIVWIIWWPCYWLVLDSKCRVMDAFGLAHTITQDNIGTIILLWLCGIGINLLGAMACCVGLFLSLPLVSLLWTVGYLMMSGQIPLQPETGFVKQI